MNDRKKNQTNYRSGTSVVNKPKSYFKVEKRAKNGCVSCKGTVVEAYPNTRFLVELDNVGNKINATLAGKLRQNYIKILVGDRVELELSVYDMTQGRISRRI